MLKDRPQLKISTDKKPTAHLVAPPHGLTLCNQKSLNFADTQPY